MTSFSTPI